MSKQLCSLTYSSESSLYIYVILQLIKTDGSYLQKFSFCLKKKSLDSLMAYSPSLSVQFPLIRVTFFPFSHVKCIRQFLEVK